MKPVRELSEELDVSKQSINRYINKQKDFKKNYVTTKDRTNYVNEDGQKEIKEHFEQSLQVKIKKQDTQLDANMPTDSQQLIVTLKKS